MLRNLSNEAITGITKYINECWRQGQLPRQWKTAKVVLIPKPGKKPQLDALRPISLTSCVGTIMEHVVLRRINDFMERNQLFSHTMVGFRPHLSTQDVMLRLKHQIIDGEKSSHLDTRVILGLDLTKAFDTIRHDAVLENLEKLGVGRRTFNYIQDFLSDRTAQISIGGVTSDDINLGGRGTPQGSVLSPYLFNVAMIELPAKLSKIEGLHHSIYADDITLWMTGGCDGFIQDTLQEAIRTIEDGWRTSLSSPRVTLERKRGPEEVAPEVAFTPPFLSPSIGGTLDLGARGHQPSSEQLSGDKRRSSGALPPFSSSLLSKCTRVAAIILSALSAPPRRPSV
ncbi:hypothetical protein ISCGN_009401 [Ixodes scapularis]